MHQIISLLLSLSVMREIQNTAKVDSRDKANERTKHIKLVNIDLFVLSSYQLASANVHMNSLKCVIVLAITLCHGK